MLLSFDNVFVSRNGFPLFMPISCSILAGTTITFRGVSGLGKTTLFNALIQWSEDVTLHGKIRLNGRGIDKATRLRKLSQTVFQEPVLFPHLSIGANVALPLGHLNRSEQRERVRTLLSKVGLADRVDDDPMALSRGQMMRVSIARALAPNPRILLMDEPFSALDPKTRCEVKALLFDTIKECDTYGLLVTHSDDDQPKDGEVICLMPPSQDC